MQLLWSFVYLIVISLLLRDWRSLARQLRAEFWLVALMGFTFSSILWSDAPDLTARRATALLFTTCFGFYFALRYSIKDQLRLLALALSIAAVASVLFQLFGLGTSVDEGVPGWIGVYVQKNQLGEYMSMATIIFLVLRRVDSEYREWITVGCALTGFLLLMSRSVTSLVVCIVAVIALFPISRSLKKAYWKIIITFVAGCVLCGYGALWVLRHLDVVTGLLGRDPTLSGRLELWILSTIMALQRPWLGYGYDAFWRGRAGASAAIWKVLLWHPPHAHDGFLELWLEIGVVGLALFLICFGSYLLRAIRVLRSLDEYEGVWPFVFLVSMFISNLTEANIMSRNSVFWIMYVTAGVTCARQLSWIKDKNQK